jgi:acetylornithine deacetylase/succinyl-diaminopimelate desuccinylase-like protein
MIISKEKLKSHFEANKQAVIAELRKYISYKSVSADPAHAADCCSCADWLKEYLENVIGLSKAEIIKTSHLPLVYAEKMVPGSTRTVLIYGHYDVQPVEGQSGWTVPPYEGVEKNGSIIARGAVDNKGQTLYVLKALEHLIKENALGVSVRVLIEGEEENGSLGLGGILPKIKDKIKADTLVVADGGSTIQNMAALSMSLRGLVAVNATIKGPVVDCHSGVFGGIVPNPAQGLAKLVASLHDENGKVAVAGFYDEVIEATEEEKISAAETGKDMLGIAESLQIPLEGGEKNIPPEIRRSFRPTLEINGMSCGYNGPGSKTIIPSEGTLKITCRTVANQDPATIGKLVVAHLEKYCPRPFTFEAKVEHYGDGMKVGLNDQSSIAAIEAGKIVYGRQPPIIWEGASIPILPAIAKAAESEIVMIGLCTVTNGMHSPDENFSLQQIESGFIYSAVLLQNLARY